MASSKLGTSLPLRLGALGTVSVVNTRQQFSQAQSLIVLIGNGFAQANALIDSPHKQVFGQAQARIASTLSIVNVGATNRDLDTADVTVPFGWRLTLLDFAWTDQAVPTAGVEMTVTIFTNFGGSTRISSAPLAFTHDIVGSPVDDQLVTAGMVTTTSDYQLSGAQYTEIFASTTTIHMHGKWNPAGPAAGSDWTTTVHYLLDPPLRSQVGQAVALIDSTTRVAFGQAQARTKSTSECNSVSPTGNVLVVTGQTETILPGCDIAVITTSAPLQISWDIWISHNNSGTFKREVLALKRDNAAGTTLASFDTGNPDGGDSTSGHQFNWTGTFTDTSPTTGHYVITTTEIDGGGGPGPASTETWSDTRTFCVSGLPYVFGQAQAYIILREFSFGQAQAYIGHFAQGQAQADIKATSRAYGQSQADIKATIRKFGQAQAFIPDHLTDDIADVMTITAATSVFTQNISGFTANTTTADPPLISNFHSGWIAISVPVGGALVSVTLSGFSTQLAIYDFVHGTATTGTTSITNLQLTGGTYYIEVSTPTDDPIVSLLQFNYARTPLAVFGQAQTRIIAFGVDRFGQAQAVLNRGWGLAQAQALLKTGFGYGQSQGFILKSAGYGQATADILATGNVFGQAKSDIKQTYAGYGQAQARVIYLGTAFAQAQAKILGRVYAQAQADIKQTYSYSAQVQADIKQTYRAFGQSDSRIAYRSRVSGQSQGYITRVEPPEAGRDFGPPQYVVMYGDFQPPGYPQSETRVSEMIVDDFLGFGWDGSETQQAGLNNFTLEMEFLIYDIDGWHSAKNQYFLAVNRLLADKGTYRKLNIDGHEGNYWATIKSIKYSAGVKDNRKVLRYVVEFDCQPWAVSDITRSISSYSSGTISTDDVGRTLADGVWTPTIINITGRDITVSGYTDTEFTGYISVSGYVSGMVIDTETFTVTVFGENGTKYMRNVDYQMWVGVGKTTFETTGVDNITVSYKNRW